MDQNVQNVLISLTASIFVSLMVYALLRRTERTWADLNDLTGKYNLLLCKLQNIRDEFDDARNNRLVDALQTRPIDSMMDLESELGCQNGERFSYINAETGNRIDNLVDQAFSLGIKLNALIEAMQHNISSRPAIFRYSIEYSASVGGTADHQAIVAVGKLSPAYENDYDYFSLFNRRFLQKELNSWNENDRNNTSLCFCSNAYDSPFPRRSLKIFPDAIGDVDQFVNDISDSVPEQLLDNYRKDEEMLVNEINRCIEKLQNEIEHPYPCWKAFFTGTSHL